MVLVFSGGAFGYEGQDLFGEYYIALGDPCIDGVISPGEWNHANWLELDQLYYPLDGAWPSDLSNASWAAMWSPETNRIYVVVTGTDTMHSFTADYGDRGDWNKYDIVEVYIDANNSDMDPYQGVWDDEGNELGEDYAQQWMTGYDGNYGWWSVLPQEPDQNETNPLLDEYRPEMAVTVDGPVLTYEYALRPYKSFGWLSGRETTELQLEADLQVGLDVVMSSKGGGGDFGMICENAWDGSEEGPDGIIGTEDDWLMSITKWNLATSFLDHWLVLDVNQAWRPRPANKAVDVPREVILQWNAGRNAGEHRVYFGTSFEEVNDANESSTGIYRGPQALANTTHTPNESPLYLDTTYYWRIDEVNGPAKWKGNTWRFMTGDYIVVEDFDSYEDTGALTAVWEDYWVNGTMSEVFLSKDVSHDGNSMEFLYANNLSPYYSESARRFSPPQDWAVSGAKALSIWFRGDRNNSITVNDRLYLALEDSSGNLAAVHYDGDPNDLKVEGWMEWNVALEDFNDVNDVDASSIAAIYIGFGDRYAPAEGGDGTVYFDDIRLYLPRCVPAFAHGDATGDCIAGFDELRIMAGDWLDSEFTVPVSEPNGELIWYKFDNEGSTYTAVDSSGNGYDGTVAGPDWVTEGCIDGALNFDGSTTQVDVPLAGLASITTEVTIALWQYGNPDIQPKADNLFEGTRAYLTEPNGIRVLNVHLPWEDERVIWCAGNPNDVYDPNVWDDCERIEKVAEFSQYAGQWNHWTFIKDCDANGGAGELRMYLNGLLWDVGHDVNVPLTGTIDKEFLIGNGADGYYAGIIDDFRIYNKVLTEAEIAYLATKGSGYYPLQDREVNFNEQGDSAEKIDFMDYAIMADYWLDEQLWPES
jgi:hypothetical protein